MKTRGSAYKSDFKRTYVQEKSVANTNVTSDERKQKAERIKCVVNCSKNKRISETYKTLHSVGRRRASNFVTYTQNGRLFYDIYVRESPYRSSKLTSSVQKEATPYTDVTCLRRTVSAHLFRAGSAKNADNSGKKLCSKATLNKYVTSASKENADVRSSANKTSKLLKRTRKSRKKNVDIKKALKRELGPDYVSPVQVHGKRLASLNATAIMGAFSAKSPRKTYVRKRISNDLSQSRLSLTYVHSDETDDAITEPMCSVIDDDLIHCGEITDSLTPERNGIFKTHKTTSHDSVEEVVPSTLKNICQINPTIESFHSQRIIPLGHDTYGVQQIMQQVVVMPPTNESPVICQPKAPDFATPNALAPLGSASFPVLSYPKPGDCNLTDTLHQRQSQIIHNPFYPNVPTQSISPWNSTLPCIANSNITPSFFACSPPNVILPHIGSPYFIPNPGIMPQVAYPLIVQSCPNVPTSYISPSLPYGIMSPVLVPTSFVQPSHLPYQSLCAPVNSNSELVCPMMISPLQMISATQPQYIQLTGSQCTGWLPQPMSGQLVSNSSAIMPTMYSIPNQPTLSYYSKPYVANHSVGVISPSTCNSSGKVDNITLSCQSSLSNILDESAKGIPSSNTTVLCTKIEKFPLNGNGSLGAKYMVENPTKKPSPTHVYSDSQKDAWVWEGTPFDSHVFQQSDAPPLPCQCYSAIRHRRDGMVIRVKDNVLLCSGPSRCHPPHVAKIIALYHDKNTDTKMMSLLWYYRPEHIAGGSQNVVKNELYASRHRDINPLDCIEDKAYVLSVSAYSRYMAKLKRQQLLSDCNECFNSVSSHSVFFCRGLYDYKLKRVTKYPVLGNQYILSSHFINRPKSSGQHSTATTTKDVSDEDNLNLSNDHCYVTSTSHMEDVNSNTTRTVTSVHENIPFNVCSISYVENTNTAIPSSQLVEIGCRLVSDCHINEECERLSYDNHEGRTSTPVKNSNNQCKALVEDSITTIDGLRQTSITEDNLNDTPRMYSANDSCVTLPKPDLLVSEVRVTSSSDVEPHFTSYSKYKLCDVVKDSCSQPLKTNCPLGVGGQIASENKSANHFACQSSFSPIQSVWPAVTASVTSCDRSVLERSADISVNWGEHGEQIALSLDCRVKENSINYTSQTTHLSVPSETLGSSQSFIDMAKLPVHSNYSKINSKCLDQDQPRLVIL
ncbi:Bromo adjacent homology domain-containing 1 protein [Schistosoma japonicum]|nr:Bromo adjacent homology domain-containing 1 protein [Schistosoma japonicum]